MAYHCARPFVPELCCTLGREAAIQKLEWTADGWLQLPGGGCLARLESEEAALPPFAAETLPGFDGFDAGVLRKDYYTPRISPETFADLESRPGWLRLRGQESLSSTNLVSLLVRKLTGVRPGTLSAQRGPGAVLRQHELCLAPQDLERGAELRRSERTGSGPGREKRPSGLRDSGSGRSSPAPSED